MSTEIEAKFIVPEVETFDALKGEPALAGYSLGPARLLSVHDTYMDTTSRAFRAAGYACRRREQEDGIVMTLKAIGASGGAGAAAGGAVHRREELEVRLPSDGPPTPGDPPARWPAGTARDAALAITGGEPLEPLFDIRQERFTREVFDGERRVATLSLDNVEAARGAARDRYRELEIELAPGGAEADLAALVGWVADRYRLPPSAHSKFERAMALPDAERPGGAGAARRGTRGTRAAVSREETVTLEVPADLSQEALLAALSTMGYQPRARATRSANEVFFDSHDGGLLRKGHLLVHSLDDGRWRLRKGETVEAEQVHEDESPPSTGEVPEALSRLTPSRVSIPFLQGSLQETEYWLRGFSARALRLFLRRWSFLSPLREAAPRDILLVIVRGSPLATGLPYFVTLLRERLHCREPRGTFLAQGLDRLGLPLPGEKVPDRFLVSPQDSVPDACRNILGGEAWRMRASVAGALQDLDIEYVHLLRVATRRARFAVRLFAASFLPDAATALRAELGWIAGLLGAVRDLDVMLVGLSGQVSLLDAPAGFEETVRAKLAARRAPALQGLAAALGSEKFSLILAHLESPKLSTSDDRGPLVRFADARVGKAVVRLGQWMARPPGSLVDADLHRLRILFKRLRYTCEFFRPLFPSEMGKLINACIGCQDCLGALQDAAVATDILQSLAAEIPPGAPPGLLLSLGALLQLQRETRRVKREEFLGLWETAPQLVERWKSIHAVMEKGQ